tara:strand:- start:1280 stop:3265 length:1986 start_codon:yes stop_codon:yes gene_type:complete
MSDRLNREWKKVEKKISRNLEVSDYREKWAEERELFYSVHKFIKSPSYDLEALAALKDKYKGERIFVIGNGPSLNKMPLELLKNEYTFCTNRFYLMYPRISWRPSFYTVVDWRVAADVTDEICDLEGSTKFYPERFRGLLPDDEDVLWYYHCQSKGKEAAFSFDAKRGIRGAGSVTGSAIQLAFHMGFEPIYLIGCDANYSVPKTVKDFGGDRFGNGIGFKLQSTEDDDPNHFDSRYFGKGRKWHDPNVKRMIAGYEQCKSGVESVGRQIFNATLGGSLEVFDRVDFLSLFEDGSHYSSSDSKGFSFNSAVANLPDEDGPKILPKINDYMVGPYYRDWKVQIDESLVIYHLDKAFENSSGVLVDVGAHHGNSSFPFANAGWQVHAFEPDQENRAILERRKKGTHKMSIFPYALSDEEMDDCAFFGSDVSSGVSSLSPFLDTHKEKSKVKVSTLAKFRESEGLEQFDFLKIDTEGYDLMVLKGNLWRGAKPRFIVSEFDEKKTNPLGYNYKVLCQYLADKGYKIYLSEWYPIEKYGMKHSWRGLKEWPCELSDDEAWGNVMAFATPVDILRLKCVCNMLVCEGSGEMRSEFGMKESMEQVHEEFKKVEVIKNKQIVKLRKDLSDIETEMEKLLSPKEALSHFFKRLSYKWQRKNRSTESKNH